MTNDYKGSNFTASLTAVNNDIVQNTGKLKFAFNWGNIWKKYFFMIWKESWSRSICIVCQRIWIWARSSCSSTAAVCPMAAWPCTHLVGAILASSGSCRAPSIPSARCICATIINLARQYNLASNSSQTFELLRARACSATKLISTKPIWHLKVADSNLNNILDLFLIENACQ